MYTISSKIDKTIPNFNMTRDSKPHHMDNIQPAAMGLIQYETEYSTPVTNVKPNLYLKHTKYTPYLTLTGELWDVYCEYLA